MAKDVTIPVAGTASATLRSRTGLALNEGPVTRSRCVPGASGSATSEPSRSTWGGEILERFSVEPSVSVNWVYLTQRSFRTKLARARFNYSFTPRMFFSGLPQYNSSGDSLSTNLRFRWEYTPGNELFVVYTDDRDTDPLMPERFSELRNCGLVVKITRLFRF